jgi:hypothetical protein
MQCPLRPVHGKRGCAEGAGALSIQLFRRTVSDLGMKNLSLESPIRGKQERFSNGFVDR